jgi:hypothetical protein
MHYMSQGPTVHVPAYNNTAMSNVMAPASTGPQGYAGYTPAHQYHAMVKSSKAKEAYKSVDLSELIIICATLSMQASGGKIKQLMVRPMTFT